MKRAFSVAASLMVVQCLFGAVCAQTPSQQAPAPIAHSGTAPAATAGENEYRLSAGDKIHVIVFGEETLTGDYVITSAGNLSFPLVGSVKADDKTVEQLQIALAAVLANGYINNPRVSIQVISFRPFYILGEVNRPGEYPVETGLTLEQAVATAGGYTYRANTHRVLLKRATEAQEHLVDLKSSDPVVIHAGDTIRIRERHF